MHVCNTWRTRGRARRGPGSSVEGQMVEALHVEQAKLLVAEAEEIARLEQSRIQPGGARANKQTNRDLEF